MQIRLWCGQHVICSQQTKYEARHALQPCQEKVKKRKHKAHNEEEQEEHDSQHRVQGDADGTKLHNEYKRGEFLIHGEDTYKKIRLDMKAITNFLTNTKEYEAAPPDQARV